MARHGLPEKMFVALARPGTSSRAVIGTDAIYYVPDNRWARERIVSDIYAKYSSYLDKGWKILGYQPVASYEMPLRSF